MDAELERLRRVETNYERDKAAMVREKAPVMARSESHEVGHAEGEEEYISPEKEALDIADRVANKLRKRAGI
jgi:hypothetical protein